jgi:phospholipid-binding lipoprotein MlaA
MALVDNKTTIKTLLIMLIISLFLGACATRPSIDEPLARAEYDKNNDPLEPFNRAMFKANLIGDKIILKPLVKIYNKAMPKPIRNGITNFLANLMEPWVMINELLQGKVKDAGHTLSRFLMNSTVGIGGLFDPATAKGFEAHNEDFGQTLGTWGFEEGIYLMLPFFGPSNPRDFLGKGMDFIGEPMGYTINELDIGKDFFLGFNASTYIRFGMEAFESRARKDAVFDELYASPDPYALARSAYRQLRAFEISDGKSGQSDEEEDLFDDDYDEEDNRK